MIDFAAVPRHSLVGRLLRVPLKLLPAAAVLPIVQGDLAGYLWMPRSSVPGCWLGYYEHIKQHLFASSIRPGDVVLDVGANVGFYTLLASRRCGPSGAVVAFEPLARNVRLLRRHLQLNRVSNAFLVAAAVADFTGDAQFAEIEDHASEGRLSPRGNQTVRVVSLDELYAAGHLVRPAVMKIDVEGAELAVLRGARRLLTEARPTVFLATHGPEVHRDCCRFLSELGYTLRPIDGPGVALDATDEVLATC